MDAIEIIPQSLDIQRMLELAAKPGRRTSLDRLFYTSRAVYERDLEKVWGRYWIWAGHASQIPDSGDYFVFEFGDESVIVVRDGEDIHALINVCRHRGSRVCIAAGGSAKAFTCPYHGWTYNLDGSFRGGRRMPKEEISGELGLLRKHVLVFEGLIFVSLADEPPSFGDRLERLAEHVGPFGLDRLKVVRTLNCLVPANWKLALENYFECYHCASAHKEYSRSHTLKDPEQMAALMGEMLEKAAAAGLPAEDLNISGPCGLGAGVYSRRYPLFPGYSTGSRDGKPLAPLLGSLKSFDGGATDIQVGMLNCFLAYSDHVVGYRFIPRDVRQTDMQVVWMVDRDAVEGRDYKPDELAWLWDVTTRDDERIIRHNQEGVNSRHFTPGPLTDMELSIIDLHDDYLAAVAGEG